MGWRKRAVVAKATPARGELGLQHAILAALNAHPGVWAMLNQRHRRGRGGQPTGGLAWPGSSDIIGMVRYDDERFVGGHIGNFFALEVKLPAIPGKVKPSQAAPREDQAAFIARVEAFGGIGAVVRSVEEALVALGFQR
jgi:hypothetical protein